jgi:SpoVK/Ycf46/Vps4 family AAA+-type ATPase
VTDFCEHLPSKHRTSTSSGGIWCDVCHRFCTADVCTHASEIDSPWSVERPIAYDLDHQPLELASPEGEAVCIDPRRQIGRTEEGDWVVSKIFLVVDYAFGDGQPVLYETATFRGDSLERIDRHHTRAEAEAGHHLAVETARAVTSERTT